MTVIPMPIAPENDRPLTYQECAEILKTSVKQVKGLPLKRVRLGYRTVRIMHSELLRYLHSRAA